jgi:hypothetical protein
MKHPWIAYVIVALLSIGAGVAIAGLPTDVPNDPTIIPPTTTTTTIAVTTTTEAAPETTERATTTTAEATTTTTSEPPTPTTTTEPAPDPATVAAAVANGSGQDGLAGDAVAFLEGLGWTDIRAITGFDVVDVTVVYYAPGFEPSARQMSVEVGTDPEAIRPLDEAPEVDDLGNAQVMVYLGTDRVTP